MPKVKLYNMEGKAVGTHELPDRIFGVAVEPELVEHAVLTQRANARVAVAHSKTRSEVRGGGKKPWRQKGTGRARHGSIRSPLWRGGGVTFGPRRERNFRLKINQKTKQKALFMVLSDKVAHERLVLLDRLELPETKTKNMVGVLKRLPLQNSTLIVLPGANETLVKSSRNIPGVTTVRGNSLNVVDVLRHRSIMMPIDAVDVVAKTFTFGAKRSGA